MNKITYLLGAGASANALPVLAEINDRLNLFRSRLQHFIDREAEVEPYNENIGIANELVADIYYLLQNVNSHLTIDTYARKLYARKSLHPELKKLKRILSTYFVFEQLPINTELRGGISAVVKQTPDKRYDSLIAALLSNKIDDLSLNNDIKILSWNYDVQLELAYMLFTGKSSLRDTHEPLQVIPGTWTAGSSVDMNKFVLVHLNGVAAYKNITTVNSSETSLIDTYSLSNVTEAKMINDILTYYKELNKSVVANEPDDSSYLSYSWENRTESQELSSKYSKESKKTAIDIARQTDILVVIGYSFPIFNRWYDKELISSMGTLKRIYIQDKNPSLIETTMKNAFTNLNINYYNNRFSLSDNLDQFVVPSELTL